MFTALQNQMQPTTPLDLIPSAAVRPMFITLIAGTVIIIAVMQFVYGTEPRVLALQMARTPANATRIIGSWNAEALHKARMNMCWDYLFIPFYSTLAAMTCFAIARHRVVGGWHEAAIVFGWMSWIAAACDLVEDLALESVWRHQGQGPFATGIAAACSYTKSGLLLVIILFAIAASLFR
jgi:hypothetical protein